MWGVEGWGGWWGVWDPTFWGHAKFEVKKSSLYLVLWSLFLQVWGGVQDPTSFGHVKFEVKIFSLYLVLWTLFLQVGGWGGGVGGVLGLNFFGSCQIWGQKKFPLFSALDSISAGVCVGRGVRDPTSFGHAKFEVKNFSLYLVLWTLFLQWGGGIQDPTFFGHAKFGVKKFFRGRGGFLHTHSAYIHTQYRLE